MHRSTMLSSAWNLPSHIDASLHITKRKLQLSSYIVARTLNVTSCVQIRNETRQRPVPNSIIIMLVFNGLYCIIQNLISTPILLTKSYSQTTFPSAGTGSSIKKVLLIHYVLLHYIQACHDTMTVSIFGGSARAVPGILRS